MTKVITLHRHPKTGVFDVRPMKSRKKPGCPGWLLHKYRNWKPTYSYADRQDAADLDRVEWRKDLQEWVAVYMSYVYSTSDHSNRSKEEYVWVWRGDKMVEIGQRSFKWKWRSQNRGWTS